MEDRVHLVKFIDRDNGNFIAKSAGEAAWQIEGGCFTPSLSMGFFDSKGVSELREARKRSAPLSEGGRANRAPSACSRQPSNMHRGLNAAVRSAHAKDLGVVAVVVGSWIFDLGLCPPVKRASYQRTLGRICECVFLFLGPIRFHSFTQELPFTFCSWSLLLTVPGCCG